MKFENFTRRIEYGDGTTRQWVDAVFPDTPLSTVMGKLDAYNWRDWSERMFRQDLAYALERCSPDPVLTAEEKQFYGGQDSFHGARRHAPFEAPPKEILDDYNENDVDELVGKFEAAKRMWREAGKKNDDLFFAGYALANFTGSQLERAKEVYGYTFRPDPDRDERAKDFLDKHERSIKFGYDR